MSDESISTLLDLRKDFRDEWEAAIERLTLDLYEQVTKRGHKAEWYTITDSSIDGDRITLRWGLRPEVLRMMRHIAAGGAKPD